jgi:hypothetical protein
MGDSKGQSPIARRPKRALTVARSDTDDDYDSPTKQPRQSTSQIMKNGDGPRHRTDAEEDEEMDQDTEPTLDDDAEDVEGAAGDVREKLYYRPEYQRGDDG